MLSEHDLTELYELQDAEKGTPKGATLEELLQSYKYWKDQEIIANNSENYKLWEQRTKECAQQLCTISTLLREHQKKTTSNHQ